MALSQMASNNVAQAPTTHSAEKLLAKVTQAETEKRVEI